MQEAITRNQVVCNFLLACYKIDKNLYYMYICYVQSWSHMFTWGPCNAARETKSYKRFWFHYLDKAPIFLATACIGSNIIDLKQSNMFSPLKSLKICFLQQSPFLFLRSGYILGTLKACRGAFAFLHGIQAASLITHERAQEWHRHMQCISRLSYMSMSPWG